MRAVPLLSDADIDATLAGLPQWERQGDALVRTYELPTFPDAIAFVVRVGFLAEKADHHPDLDVRWRKVTVLFTSHDSGGITERDATMALAVDGLVE
ncbi:MAG: phhB [Actinomycetia bacterium]|nr:phhB [Actinomycetes bacterium]